jgi:tetratricopeptide (TPR) repeat protein
MATRLIKTSLSHRGYSLVKMSYPLFGLAFIDMFSSQSWFGTDIQWLGIPTIIAILVTSHIFLLFLQTDRAARLFYLFKRGKPPALYLNWLEVEEAAGETAVRLGLRRLNLACVDELHLTIWGNLIFKSRSVCGSLLKDGRETIEADDVFKIPFGVIASRDQKEFVELVQKVRPDVVLGKRLEKRMSARHVKGEDYIQALGAVFLLFVLFDLSFSLFGYLEMLKEYHLAQVSARSVVPSQTVSVDSMKAASDHFATAESMLQSPPGISLVKRTILNKGFSTGAVYQARAEALWYLGKKEEAIKSLEKALEFYPKSLRMHLELVRWLAQTERLREARKVLADMADEHEDVLLPRLYTLVLFSQAGDKDKVKRYYEIYSDQLDLEVFGEEPWWPPGGNRYLNDSWSRDDVHFLLDELLKGK